jgi:hypothetical protein
MIDKEPLPKKRLFEVDGFPEEAKLFGNCF